MGTSFNILEGLLDEFDATWQRDGVPTRVWVRVGRSRRSGTVPTVTDDAAAEPKADGGTEDE